MFEEKIFKMDDLLIEYLIKQNSNEQIWSHDVDLAYLVLLSKIIGHYIATNNIELVKEIISFEGRLWNSKFSQNSKVALVLLNFKNSFQKLNLNSKKKKKIIQESLGIYKMLIVVKSIPIVQEVYKNILFDSEISFNTVLKYSNSANEAICLTDDKPRRGVKLLNLVKQAETSFLFNLCVFGELGNAKNNLILVILAYLL